MNMLHDDEDLKRRFTSLREAEHAAATRWHPELIRGEKATRRWMPALACAAVVMGAAAFWIPLPAAPSVADLPPLWQPGTGELFASLDAPSSDFLLPTHLTIHLP
jgi:hypothetical protein